MTIDWGSLVSGLIGALVGSIVTYGLWHIQDRTSRRREWIAEHLQRTYFKLIEATTIPEAGDGQSLEKKRAMAEVFNEINLLGTPETIQTALETAKKLKLSEETGEWVSYEELFKALKGQLRNELGLEKSDRHALMFAYQKPNGEPSEEK